LKKVRYRRLAARIMIESMGSNFTAFFLTTIIIDNTGMIRMQASIGSQRISKMAPAPAEL